MLIISRGGTRKLLNLEEVAAAATELGFNVTVAEAGADVGHAERAGGGLTPLHIAAGYGRATGVRALLELGADAEGPDGKGRTPLELVQEVLAATPKGVPAAFERRQALEAAAKELEKAVYEWGEVEKVVEV